MNKSIIIAATILALAILVSARYQVNQAGDTAALWVFDSWTGSLEFCTHVRGECRDIHR